MKIETISNSIIHFFRVRSVPLLRENGKIIAQFILTTFFIGIGIWFIKQERAELFEVQTVINSASQFWILIGIGLTIVYIVLQGLMYVASFAAVQSKVSLVDAIILFLKRNFVSIFLPAGGISSLAFFAGSIEKKGVKETQIHFASTIYGFVGILSVAIVAIPTFLIALIDGTVAAGEWYALTGIILLCISLIFMYKSILNKGYFFRLVVRFLPASEVFIEDLFNNKIDRNKFLLTIFYSILIEFAGIAHLYVAMIALNYMPSLYAAIMAYIISVIFLIISPFLRGLGAIEVSMGYILIRNGFGNVEAIAVTFLYRFFEFWLPLLTGALSFLVKLNKLLMRIVPAIFLLALGIINIISVLTPAIKVRLHSVKSFLPIEAIHASNYLVMMAGLFLLVTAAFMLKGLRSAWWFALILSFISLIGHLTKAIDYEEAIVAFVVIMILISTRKEYYIKNNPRLRLVGIETALLSIAAVLIYGIIGFYFLDKKHFQIDFGLIQSFKYTLQNYFLLGSEDLIPVDGFARKFLDSIQVSGFISMGFLIYTLVYPFNPKDAVNEEDKNIAINLIKQYGRSSLDYFKTYSDKLVFLSQSKLAFISYRVSGNFAVVLENPVAANESEMVNCIKEFDLYCYDNGLKSIYYRVPEAYLAMYTSLDKKNLFLGQVGVVDLLNFSLEGSSKKSMRNALKKVSEKGLKTSIHFPPIKDGLLQKLKSVSDEWLIDTERTEIIFSQGMFDWDELKQHTIISIENSEEKIIAFLDIIPDYAEGEGTYDLIRKTSDAPNGIMDFILVELFNYLKSHGFTSVNLGLAPMSGMEDPNTFREKSIKFAYEKIKSFSHYKGLRDYKEKFSPEWYNEYLIYSHDYDLLQVPVVLSNVIKV